MTAPMPLEDFTDDQASRLADIEAAQEAPESFDAVAALRRVEALADEASTIPAWSTLPDDVHERDWRAGYAAAMADFADRLRVLVPTVDGEETVSAYLRDALESLASAAGVPVDADYGPKPNGVLLDDLHLWVGGVRCRHCGGVGVPGGDHTCSCPMHDNDCAEHPDPRGLSALGGES